MLWTNKYNILPLKSLLFLSAIIVILILMGQMDNIGLSQV